MDLRISFAAIGDYDRTGPLLEGRIKPAGVELEAQRMPAVDLFRRVLADASFDMAEMSASNYLVSVARGDDRYVALPVFPSRAFRHSAAYVGAGIGEPAQLRGRVVGTSDYYMTALLWLRAALAGDYGIAASDMEWWVGGLNEDELRANTFGSPRGITLREAPAGRCLDDLLAAGEIAAVLDARPPRSFLEGRKGVHRLWDDYRTVEQDYFRRTRRFPIMHLVVIRRALVDAHEWLAESLVNAFDQARTEGLRRLTDTTSAACALPWLQAAVDDARSLLGPDWWPYGLAANRETLEYMTAQAFEQGLTARQLELAELFVEETWDRAGPTMTRGE